MQRFVIAIIALLYLSISLSAYDGFYYDSFNLKFDGLSPLKVLKDESSGKLHIFCAGQDLNFNYEVNEGDESSSWWIIDSHGTPPRLVMHFDGFIKNTPFRPAHDPVTNILYVPMIGKIVSLDLDEEDYDDEELAYIDAQSVHFAGGHLLITVASESGENGKVEVMNLQTGQILQTVQGGKNIIDCIYYPGPEGISIAILNQGDFGSDNSNVMYGAINHMFDFELEDDIEVGNSANHIIYHDGKLYVTVNMSHWIKVIDVSTHEVSTWHTATSGFDGPRESKVKDGFLYVTTYSGDVRIFDLKTGVMLNIFEDFGNYKIEDIEFISDDLFYTASPFDQYYGVPGTLTIWDKKENPFAKLLSKIEVGSAPAGLFYFNDALHVFCAGLADGTEKPSWWTIQKEGNLLHTEQKYEFELGDIKIPFRPAFDLQSGTMYIPAENTIKSYNLNDFTIEDDMVLALDAVSLKMAGTHLLAAVRYPERADSIVVVNLQTGSILQKVYAGNYVEDMQYYALTKKGESPEISLAILTHEDESKNNSILMYGPISHMAEFSLENSISAGSNARNLDIGKNLIGVSSSLSNELIVVNAENGDSKLVNIGTNDLFGPMGLMYIDNGGFVVGTAANDVRAIKSMIEPESDLSAELKSTIQTEMFGEYIYFKLDEINNELLIAATCTANKDGDINKSVHVISDLTVSVREYQRGDIAGIKVYPNPAGEIINFEVELRENSAEQVSYEIISMQGIVLLNGTLPYSQSISHTIDLSVLNLPSGTYILDIKTGRESKSLPISIVR